MSPAEKLTAAERDRLVEIYDRLLELYVARGNALDRGDRNLAASFQSEIDRLIEAKREIKQWETAGSA